MIAEFNTDLPFDQFIREQIVADRVDDPTNPKSLAALGFLTVGSRYNFSPHEIIDDRIDVVTRGFLGLTYSCARCHDHGQFTHRYASRDFPLTDVHGKVVHRIIS